ncbi:putative porin [Rheinheimera pacifica]|uniref:porin n=1 Tax=Rheinheimera pacifica TaxID=173990 RepID=UPI002169D442|nr:porin [Rheinheimera pacifica]MCS4307900.1 putative porin [Rheinheimera pacifica]
MQQATKIAITSAVLICPAAAANTASVPVPTVSFYGKAEVQLAHTDKGLLRYTEQGSQLDTPFSRFGLRGEQQLNEHITAFFTYEVDVRGFDEQNTQNPFAARNTFIGIKGNFGQLIGGRNDTRLKTSEGGIDLFNETSADIAQILPGQDRLGDSLTYISPQYNQWQLSVTYVLGQDNELQDGKDGGAISLSYGDSKLKQQPYFITLTQAHSLNGLNASRLMWQQQLANFTLGALLQYSKETYAQRSGTGGYISLQYTMGDWQPKLQLGRDTSQLRQQGRANHYTAGIDYLFNSQSKAYFFVTHLDITADSSEADSSMTDTSVADTSVAVGLQYRF